MAIAKVNPKRITKEKSSVFQFFASGILLLSGMLFCHQVKGLFILVAAIQFNNAILKYATPPPSNRDKTDKPKKPNAPCFRPIKKVDQTINEIPIKTAAIPVIRKFGIKVKAISPTPPSNLMAESIASIWIPLVGTFPCISSKNPCSILTKPPIAPMIDTTL